MTDVLISSGSLVGNLGILHMWWIIKFRQIRQISRQISQSNSFHTRMSILHKVSQFSVI
jgi:hypothetical protein